MFCSFKNTDVHLHDVKGFISMITHKGVINSRGLTEEHSAPANQSKTLSAGCLEQPYTTEIRPAFLKTFLILA